MRLKRLILGVSALSLLVSCGSNQGDTGQQALQSYETIVVSQSNAVLESAYPANIEGQQDIEIRPRIDGFIEAIYVDEGAVVKKGQQLFKINSPSSIQAVQTAEAAVNSAEAALNTAQLNRDRFAPLVEKGIVSKVQYDTYVNAYESSLANLAQAKAQLSNAQATLSWTNVTSPVDGVVGEIPYRQGSLVNNENVLTTVANTGNVFVYFSVNEKELMDLLLDLPGNTQSEKIQSLPEVTLILANGAAYPYKGKINAIQGLANVSTGSIRLRAEFPNGQGLLRSGFSGRLVIPQEVDNTIVIPQASTFQQQNKVMTYKVQGDSVVQTLVSVLPMPDGKSYVVTDGLSVGDRIVASGLATLQNGKKIAVK